MKTKKIDIKKITALLVLIAIIALAVAVLITPASAGSLEAVTGYKEIDIYLIAGQSNAVGYGDTKAHEAVSNANYVSNGYTGPDGSALTAGISDVYYYGTGDGKVVSEFTNVTFGMGQGGTYNRSGAELGIATAVTGNGRTSAIIKYARGSSYIAPNTTHDSSTKYGTWTPPSYIRDNNIDTSNNNVGDLYLAFLQTVSEGLANLIAKGYTPVIKGMWYMQGEAETNHAAGTYDYDALLEALIKDIRADLTKVSGTNCLDMPFVFGKIKWNDAKDTSGNYLYNEPANLDGINADQAAVAERMKDDNVYMLNLDTDLLALESTPTSIKAGTAVQQDRWHYNAETQQMIGEAFIRTINYQTKERPSASKKLPTKYTTISMSESTEAADISSYPAVVFNAKTAATYTWRHRYANLKGAIERARGLLDPTALTSDPTQLQEKTVVYIRKDLSVTNTVASLSNIQGGTLTVDLGGHTLSASQALMSLDLDDWSGSSATEQVSNIVVRNGRILVGSAGIINANYLSALTKSATVNITFEGVHIGFASGSTAKHLLAYATDTASSETASTVNFNYINCTIDTIANRSASYVALADFRNTTAETDTARQDAAWAKHNATFTNCTFRLENASDLCFVTSGTGDNISIVSTVGEQNILVKNNSANTYEFTGDYGATKYYIVSENYIQAGLNLYTMSTTAPAVSGSYGEIGAAYADANAYPYALFVKNGGAYSFSGGFDTWRNAGNKAIELANANGGAESVTILLRRDIAEGTYISGMLKLNGVIDVDLNGYTLNLDMAMFNSGAAEGLGGGTMNLKNGKIFVKQHGLVYAEASSGSPLTSSATFNMNFVGIYLGYQAGAQSNLIAHTKYGSPNASGNEIYELNFKNCTLDLYNNATSASTLGDAHAPTRDNSDAASSPANTDYHIYFDGCRILTHVYTQLAFSESNADDFFKFINSDTNPSELLVKGGQYSNEPAVNTLYNTSTATTVAKPVYSAVSDGYFKVFKLSSVEMLDTPYGKVPSTYKDSYFMLFSNVDGVYTLLETHSTWRTAFEAAVTYTSGATPTYSEVVIYMNRDFDSGSDANDYGRNVHDITSKVTVDLGGHTLTVTALFNTTIRDSSVTTAINFKDGKVLTKNHALVYVALNKALTAASPDVGITFNNVYIGFDKSYPTNGKNVLISEIASGDSARAINYRIGFTNCTIDLYNNVTSAAYLAKGAKNSNDASKENIILSFKNCDILAHDAAQFGFANWSTNSNPVYDANTNDFTTTGSGDRIMIQYNGSVYSRVLLPSATYVPTPQRSENGSVRKPVYLNATNEIKYGLVVHEYMLTSQDLIPGYNVIVTDTNAHDTAAYPFVLLIKQTDGTYKFLSAETSYYNAMTKAINHTRPYVEGYTKYDEVVVYMRAAEHTATEYPRYLSGISTKVVLDLNQNILHANNSLGNTKTHDYKDSSGTVVAINGTLEIKNGTVLTKAHPLIYIDQDSATYAGKDTLNINFIGCNIGMDEGCTSPALITRVAAYNNTSNSVSYFNFSFNNCTIDFSTNRPSSLVAANLAKDPAADYCHIKIYFNSSNLIADSMEHINFSNVTAGKDGVYYSKVDGGLYSTVTLKAGAAAPTGSFLSGPNGDTLVLSAVSVGTSTTVYRFGTPAVSGIVFNPMSSITLGAELSMNVYVPVHEKLVKFELLGKLYDSFASLRKVTVGESEYYLVNIPLPSTSAADTVTFRAYLDIDGKTYAKNWKFTLANYAEKSIADANSSAEEKQLIKDILAYIIAAYNYFKVEDAEAVDTMQKLLELPNYVSNNMPSIEGSTATPSVGLAGASLIMDANPRVRFIMKSGFEPSAFEFFDVNGNKLQTKAGVDAESGVAYIDVTLYAHQLADAITYKISGVESGSYHIHSYQDYAVASGDAGLKLLINNFWKYLQSARAYKEAQSK